MALKNTYSTTQTLATIGASANGASIPLKGAKTFSAQIDVTVNTPALKTFVQGTRQIQIIDYVADVAGSLNNKYYLLNSWNAVTNASKGFYVWFNINSAGVDPAVAGRTGIQITGATNVAAATLVSSTKTALDALTNDFATSTAATFHLTVANANPGSVTAAADGTAATGFTFNAPSTAGVNSTVNPLTDRITIAAHGFPTGLKLQGTDTGTLPAGITTGVDYFVIVVDANTIQLADTLVHAQAGTALDLTNYGSNAGTGTLTPTALAGATVQLQKSNDGTNWYAQGSAVSITATGTTVLDWVDPTTKYVRIAYVLTAGSFSAAVTPMVQAD